MWQAILAARCGPSWRSQRLLLSTWVRNHKGRRVSVKHLDKLCNDGRIEEALEAVECMHHHHISISKHMIYSLLQGCTKRKDLEASRRVHLLMVSSKLDSIAFLNDHLIRLFALCGSLKEANQVFLTVANPSVYTWNSIISAHVKLGQAQMGLHLYHRMQQQGVLPDKVTFLCTLKACSSIGDLQQGKLIHEKIIACGFEADVAVGNCLVDMYAKCGSLEEARKFFDELPERDSVSWGAMIAGYTLHEYGLVALELYENMLQEGLKPNKVEFLSVLKACGSIGDINQGSLIHEQIIKCGLDSDIVIGNTLVDMYAKCGSIEKAHKVFDGLPNRDVVSWGAMIAGYVRNGDGLSALDLYKKMQQKGMTADKATLLWILKACGSIGDIQQGKFIHQQIKRNGSESDKAVGSTLVDMYAKCGSIEDARKVFDGMVSRDVVSWGAMLAGYAQHGQGIPALELYAMMLQEGLKPNKVIYLCTLKACASIGALQEGRLVHNRIINIGLETDVAVGNSLIDMYVKCGKLQEARIIFDRLPTRDVVSWGAMIAGYAQDGDGLPALDLYENMQKEGILPDEAMCLCILKACGSIGALGQGRLIHEQILKMGLESDMAIGNTLVDMYFKCGSLEEACRVFSSLPNRDSVSWASMIAGYAQSGKLKLARLCLENMKHQGLKMNDVAFLLMLRACSHSGLLDEGCWLFKSVIEDYGIQPSIRHYTCMVDLLSRSGCLNEAEKVLQTMPVPPDIIGWTSLLTGCRTYGNVELGKRCFDQIVGLDSNDASAYVLMSNIYADARMWGDAKKIHLSRKRGGAWKKPGKAWIEVNNKVHEFVVGGKDHPQSNEIYAMLKRLSLMMKEEGYVPHLDLVLEPMLEEEKEDVLCGHCEKLAIAFGLVITPEGTTIRAIKNLRVCTDCHNASKAISKIEKREIIIRDAYRIHHLKDGICSCRDYY